MDAANAPPPAGEEEEADELTAGEEAAVRRLETAARKGRINFQPKVEAKVTKKPSASSLEALHPGHICACVLSLSAARACPLMGPCKRATACLTAALSCTVCQSGCWGLLALSRTTPPKQAIGARGGPDIEEEFMLAELVWAWT